MLTRMRLEHFKSWQDTSNITLRPITGFFGANSSGKTSLIQAILLLKQTADSPDRGIVFHFGDRRTPWTWETLRLVLKQTADSPEHSLPLRRHACGPGRL